MANAKKNYLQKVLDFLQGGDEGKIKKFQKRAVRKLNDTISSLESDIETLEFKREDVVEAKAEALVNVDVSRLQSTDGIDSYIEEYLRTQVRKDDELKDIDKKIAKAKEKIETSKSLIKELA